MAGAFGSPPPSSKGAGFTKPMSPNMQQMQQKMAGAETRAAGMGGPTPTAGVKGAGFTRPMSPAVQQLQTKMAAPRGGPAPGMAPNLGSRPAPPMGPGAGVKPAAAPNLQAQQMQARLAAAKGAGGPQIQANSPFAGARMFAKGGKVMKTGDRAKYAK